MRDGFVLFEECKIKSLDENRVIRVPTSITSLRVHLRLLSMEGCSAFGFWLSLHHSPKRLLGVCLVTIYAVLSTKLSIHGPGSCGTAYLSAGAGGAQQWGSGPPRPGPWVGGQGSASRPYRQVLHRGPGRSVNYPVRHVQGGSTGEHRSRSGTACPRSCLQQHGRDVGASACRRSQSAQQLREGVFSD